MMDKEHRQRRMKLANDLMKHYGFNARLGKKDKIIVECLMCGSDRKKNYIQGMCESCFDQKYYAN